MLLALSAGTHGDAPLPAAQLRQAYARPPAQWPAPTLHPSVEFVEMGPLALAPAPAGAEAALAELGRLLFGDPLLSRAGDIACRTCHDPARGWGDGQPVSTGHEGMRTRRNAPALFSAAYRASWSWDGRHVSLAAQALAPLTDAAEMANDDLASVTARLNANAEYSRRFAAVFGKGPVTQDDLAAALTAFLGGLEETTRFDRFVAGDRAALDDREIWGLHLFRTRAGCANCHFGPLLSDERFHNLRLSSFGEPSEDLGRFDVSGEADAVGAFRTPSLRHVARTGPYMHNGLFANLRGVVRLYMRGGGEVRARNEEEARHPLYPSAAQLAAPVAPFTLDEEELDALVAFLNAL